MAMQKCAECEQILSDKARVCPHCGAPSFGARRPREGGGACEPPSTLVFCLQMSFMAGLFLVSLAAARFVSGWIIAAASSALEFGAPRLPGL